MSGGKPSWGIKWTETELSVLRSAIRDGLPRCEAAKLLPHRSPTSISDRMLRERRAMGIKATIGRSRVMNRSIPSNVDPIAGNNADEYAEARIGSEKLLDAMNRYYANRERARAA